MFEGDLYGRGELHITIVVSPLNSLMSDHSSFTRVEWHTMTTFLKLTLESLSKRRFYQHERRPEVNQAVVGGVGRSCLKSQTVVTEISRLRFESRTAVVIYNGLIHFRPTSVLIKTSLS